MIIDARWTNSHFSDPPDVELATGQSFAMLEVDAGEPVWLGGVDIANCFYTLELPAEFRGDFALPRIRGRDVGVAAEGAVFPCLKVIPMGWNQALMARQLVHEAMAVKIEGISAVNRTNDGAEVPPMQPLVHAEYVDNFAAYAGEKAPVAEAARRVNALFRSKGLPAHGVEVSQGGASLGWEFASDASLAGPSRLRLWRLRLGIQEVLRRPRVSGRVIEIVAGHLTFVGLLRREFLSVFGAVYAFISQNREREIPLWPAVRRELKRAPSLLPLLRRDRGAAWSDTACVSDASPWGRGVVEGERGVALMAAAGRVSERWRFSKSDELGARARLHCELQQSRLRSQEKDNQWPDSSAPASDFREISPELMGGDWRVVSAGRWWKSEHMPLLEARAVLWALKHQLRRRRSFGKKLLFIVDAMSIALMFSTGRSSSSPMNRICRQWSAL